MPAVRDRLLVLHIVGQYPMAGIAWQALHYLLGFRELGWDVTYVEDSGASPYDPDAQSVTGDCGYAVRYVRNVMERSASTVPIDVLVARCCCVSATAVVTASTGSG